MIKAVIFDMDGVLIDAKDWHYESLNKSLELFGFQISRYDHLVTFDGLPTAKKLEILSRDRGLSKSLHKFINELKQIYTIDMVHQKCRPVFYHQYCLSKLKQNGYRLVVASNSIQATIKLMMEKSDLDRFLDFFLSNQDVKHPKPDPEIYVTAIQKLECRPDEVLIVEDNEHGIKAAMGSGAHVMRVNDVTDVNYLNIMQAINRINQPEAANNA